MEEYGFRSLENVAACMAWDVSIAVDIHEDATSSCH